jgi:cell division protein FtsB
MAARLIAVVLLSLIAGLQYSVWLGKGGWLRVWDIDVKIAGQLRMNAALQSRNDALEAEVKDLKEGYGAIEERARHEMGMIRQDEIFVQVLQHAPAKPAAKTPSEAVH